MDGLNQIGRITPSGTITEFPLPTSSYGVLSSAITTGPDGNLWFSVNGAIGRVTPSGTITEFPLSTNSFDPYAITAGPDGNLWFTETNSNKIGRLHLNH